MTTLPAIKARVRAGGRVTFESTSFGMAAVLPMPDDCDMILVCVGRLRHEPLKILLPHQLYLDAIKAIFAEHPEAMSITVMPYRNADKIEIRRAALTPEP